MAKPGTRNHGKYRRLVRLLGEPDSHVYGYLHMLWEVAYERGEPRIGDALDVALACGYPGDPQAITQALVTCGGEEESGFLQEIPGQPGRYEVHNLYKHAPEYVVKRRLRELSKVAQVAYDSLREAWKACQIDLVHPDLSEIRQRCRPMSDKVGQSRPMSDVVRSTSPYQPLETETKAKDSSAAAAAGTSEELELTPPGDSQAPRKRRRREKHRPSNPDVPRLIRHYSEEFVRTQGSPPLIEAADAAAVPKILAGRPFDGPRGASWLVTQFLEDPESWSKERGLLRLRDLPAAVTKILARGSRGGGNGRRDSTGAPVPEHRETVEDTVGVDEEGVRRLVKIKRDAATGVELARTWGRPVELEGGLDGEEQRHAAG